jgi:hypothetical protein
VLVMLMQEVPRQERMSFKRRGKWRMCNGVCAGGGNWPGGWSGNVEGLLLHSKMVAMQHTISCEHGQLTQAKRQLMNLVIC